VLFGPRFASLSLSLFTPLKQARALLMQQQICHFLLNYSYYLATGAKRVEQNALQRRATTLHCCRVSLFVAFWLLKLFILTLRFFLLPEPRTRGTHTGYTIPRSREQMYLSFTTNWCLHLQLSCLLAIRSQESIAD